MVRRRRRSVLLTLRREEAAEAIQRLLEPIITTERNEYTTKPRPPA